MHSEISSNQHPHLKTHVNFKFLAPWKVSTGHKKCYLYLGIQNWNGETHTVYSNAHNSKGKFYLSKGKWSYLVHSILLIIKKYETQNNIFYIHLKTEISKKLFFRAAKNGCPLMKLKNWCINFTEKLCRR